MALPFFANARSLVIHRRYTIVINVFSPSIGAKLIVIGHMRT